MVFIIIMESVIHWVLVVEIVSIAIYNFFFEPLSYKLNRGIRTMFSAIVLAVLAIIFLVRIDPPIIDAIGNGDGWNIFDTISIILDVWIITFVTRDVIAEIKELKRH